MASSSALVLAGLLRIASPEASPPVQLAAADLAADCERVLGTAAQRVRAGETADVVLELQPSLTGPEAWRIEVSAAGIRISGSDPLGLVYGIYAFSERCLGVDPLWFWKGMPPEKRARLELAPQTLASTPAKFRYRGWFINDEDLLTEFGTSAGPRHIDYPFYARVIDLAMAERIYEALLRLGGNLIIPASFVDVMNPPEAELVRRAVARGLYVTQHHVEPMGVSHFGFENYWKARGAKKEFRYATEPDAVRAVWRDYAAKWRELARDQVVWQLGMRGRGDRPIWANDKAITPETAGDFISRAIADQWEIVRMVDPRSQPPATTTLWAEGSELMAAGKLKLPAGITVVFADLGASQELQRDFHECPRLPQYRFGVYYHVAFWRRGPHLVQGVAPERIVGTFRQMEARRDNQYALVNVSNIREHVLGAHTFIRTAWHGAQRPLEQTLAEFAPPETRPFMNAFYAALVRRPDGVWLQDGDCVDAVAVFLGAKKPAERGAAVRKYVDPDVLETAAARFEKVASAGELATVPERWRAWTRDYFIVQANYLAALYRTVAALAREQPAEAVRHLEKSLEIRAPLATGQWEGWYVGDKKANWLEALRRLRAMAGAK